MTSYLLSIIEIFGIRSAHGAATPRPNDKAFMGKSRRGHDQTSAGEFGRLNSRQSGTGRPALPSLRKTPGFGELGTQPEPGGQVPAAEGELPALPRDWGARDL